MKKVMLVDDKSISNFIMKKYFELKAPEHEVIDFTDPELAFSKLTEIEPDIIFLDLNMPRMDGWDFLKGMQEQQLDFKVAILTSSTSQEDLSDSGAYSNVINFFVKPFDANELERVLDSM
jgi:two-component system nitrate/nitrite response regulator NarL